MSSGYDSLTNSQKQQFEQQLQALGFDLEEVKKININTGNSSHPTIITEDPVKSALEPKFFVVKNVAELKQAGGVPDEIFTRHNERMADASAEPLDAHIEYPDPLEPALEPSTMERLINKSASRENLAGLIGPENWWKVRKALRAYTIGNSAKVKERGYEPLINALHFPQVAVVFAANDITVTPDQPLIINPPNPGQYTNNNPYKMIVGTLTIVDGGQIISSVPLSMNVQQMIKKNTTTLKAASGNNISSVGANGTDGRQGNSGGLGSKGSDGRQGTDGTKTCSVNPVNGTDGGTGSNGSNGSDGSNGGMPNDLNFNVDSISGEFTALVGGGIGGAGGAGGAGGKGGTGGSGANATTYCSAALGGKGGKGGNGGDGGNGGNGGDGATITIYYKSNEGASILKVTNPSQGGAAGGSGNPGDAGTPGSNGAGDLGSGNPGKTGKTGQPGLPGTVIFQKN